MKTREEFTTNERKQIIAEFMGWYNVGYSTAFNHPTDPRIFNVNEFNYDISYDCLMPVIIKIKDDIIKKGYIEAWEQQELYYILDKGSPIIELFKATSDYIRWHNQKN